MGGRRESEKEEKRKGRAPVSVWLPVCLGPFMKGARCLDYREVFGRGSISTGVNVKRIRLASLGIRLGRDTVVQSLCFIYSIYSFEKKDEKRPSGIIRAGIDFFQ